MKVLIINKSYMSGGAGIASGRLFKTLQQSSVDVKMMVFDPTPKDDNNLIKLSTTKYHQLRWWFCFLFERIYFLPFEKGKKLRYAFSPAISGIDISEHQAVKEADVIHLHWFNQGFLSIKSLQKLFKLGKPVVFTLHDMWAFTGGCHYTGDCDRFKKQCGNCIYLKNPSLNDLSAKGYKQKKEIYSEVDLSIVTCSNWLGTIASESSLLNAKSITAIPNSIDVDFYLPSDKKEIRKKLNLPTDRKLLLFGAANLSDTRKGLSYFLESIEVLDADFEIVVFGKNSHLVSNQQKYKVHDFGLISSAETMKELYLCADMFIIPSLQDNLPNTVMESMACETPVVSFNTGGIPEMIDHLRNGYIAEYKSAEDLARGIEWVLTNNNDNVLGKAAREKVIREYSQEVVAQKHIQLYQSILNEAQS